MGSEVPIRHEATPEVSEYLAEMGMPFKANDILHPRPDCADWRWYFVRSAGVCGWIGTDRADVPVRLRKLFREVYDGEAPPAVSKAASAKVKKDKQEPSKQSEISMEHGDETE